MLKPGGYSKKTGFHRIKHTAFSFIALGKDGECLTNVVTWADIRSKNQAEATGKQFDAYDLYARTAAGPTILCTR